MTKPLLLQFSLTLKRGTAAELTDEEAISCIVKNWKVQFVASVTEHLDTNRHLHLAILLSEPMTEDSMRRRVKKYFCVYDKDDYSLGKWKDDGWLRYINKDYDMKYHGSFIDMKSPTEYRKEYKRFRREETSHSKKKENLINDVLEKVKKDDLVQLYIKQGVCHDRYKKIKEKIIELYWEHCRHENLVMKSRHFRVSDYENILWKLNNKSIFEKILADENF